MRKIAFIWAEYAEKEFQMRCIYEEGSKNDLVSFVKPGVKGNLKITHNVLELRVRLGLLLSPFSKNIENKIISNLDMLLKNYV